MKTYQPRVSSPLAVFAHQSTQAAKPSSSEQPAVIVATPRRFKTVDRYSPLPDRPKRHLLTFLQTALPNRAAGPLRTSELLHSHDKGERLKRGLMRDHFAVLIVSAEEMVPMYADALHGKSGAQLPPVASQAAFDYTFKRLEKQAALSRAAIIGGHSILPRYCPMIPDVVPLRDSLGVIQRELYLTHESGLKSVLRSAPRLTRLLEEVDRHDGYLIALPGHKDPVFILPDVSKFNQKVHDKAAQADELLRAELDDSDSDSFSDDPFWLD